MKRVSKFICVAALSTFLHAMAQADERSTQPNPDLVRVRITVTSQRYGSFVQEKAVSLGQPATFSAITAHHPGMLYDGKCPVTKVLPVIDDGVVVKVRPMQVLSSGEIGAQLEIRADKFLKYREFDQGICGKMSFASSEGIPPMVYGQFFPAGQEITVFDTVSRSSEFAVQDLNVKAEFSPDVTQ